MKILISRNKGDDSRDEHLIHGNGNVSIKRPDKKNQNKEGINNGSMKDEYQADLVYISERENNNRNKLIVNAN